MIFSDGRIRRSAAARAFRLLRIASSGFGITSDMTPSRHARAGRPLVFPPPPHAGGLFLSLAGNFTLTSCASAYAASLRPLIDQDRSEVVHVRERRASDKQVAKPFESGIGIVIGKI